MTQRRDRVCHVPLCTLADRRGGNPREAQVLGPSMRFFSLAILSGQGLTAQTLPEQKTVGGDAQTDGTPDQAAVRMGLHKGKSAISIARRFMGKTKNFTSENFWAQGYFVSTVGLNEEVVRAYIRNQEKDDEQYDQLKFGL